MATIAKMEVLLDDTSMVNTNRARSVYFLDLLGIIKTHGRKHNM